MEAARTTTDWKCKCTARAGQESLSLVQVARIREYKTPKQLNKETRECTEKARKYATEAKRSRVRECWSRSWDTGGVTRALQGSPAAGEYTS